MECKYIRENTAICFTFNPSVSSIFLLIHFKNRLRIVEQNLYTGLVMNQFAVPLKEENLNVSNYILTHNADLNVIILTLYNHILIFSLQDKILIFLGETHGKNPYYIERCATKGKFLYLIASEQHNIYGVNLSECIRTQAISHYTKYKIPVDTELTELTLTTNRIIAVCQDSNIRVWDLDSTNQLKGTAIQKGMPTCMALSRDSEFLLLGTQSGFVQAWDGDTIGVQNTLILEKSISPEKIQAVCWFHYAGDSQSRRFLVMSNDGNVKLYSLWFQKQQGKSVKYMGKCQELCHLYQGSGFRENYRIEAHNYANFILFSPGILLYLVDSNSRIYYPIFSQQLTLSFEQYVPNAKKEIYLQRDYLYIEDLLVKKVKDQIINAVVLKSILEYEGLKVLRMDYRPKCIHTAKKSMLLISYYLGTMQRSITIKNIDLNLPDHQIENYKEYNGSSAMFLGLQSNPKPFLLILSQSKQGIRVLSEHTYSEEDRKHYDNEEQLYLIEGELVDITLKNKVHRIYWTPFRNGYVVVYQVGNWLCYSRNGNYEHDLLDYQMMETDDLELHESEIILDVIWSARGEIGCILCLDQCIIINSDLKRMMTVPVEGYIVQGTWLGYTLMLTTKLDIQYITVLGKVNQLCSLESYEMKYLIMGIFADRIIGIQKQPDSKIAIKGRYFNLMEPLLAGYLAYHKALDTPIDPQVCKRVIECLAPYHIVSEEFLVLLNQNNLDSFSTYFIEGNYKLYSKSIRAQTLNTGIHVERFINEDIWAKHKRSILDLYLHREESKDSTDAYEKDKGEQYEKILIQIIGNMAFQSIKEVAHDHKYGLTIVSNFGDKNLAQVYHDFTSEGDPVRMEIERFKAENIGEWIGIFGGFLDAKPLSEETGGPVVEEEDNNEASDDENEFKHLLIYYRFDEGKAEAVEDLSDYANDATVDNQESWEALDEEPVECEDKWGKKVPPQFSIKDSSVRRDKKINGKNIGSFTIEVWMKPNTQSFSLIEVGETFSLAVSNLHFEAKTADRVYKYKAIDPQIGLKLGVWTHVAFIYDKAAKASSILLNSLLYAETAAEIELSGKRLLISSQSMKGEVTQFRFWRKAIVQEQVKENMRVPLEIVAEKKKKIRIKLKQNKKKLKQEQEVTDFPSW